MCIEATNHSTATTTTNKKKKLFFSLSWINNKSKYEITYAQHTLFMVLVLLAARLHLNFKILGFVVLFLKQQQQLNSMTIKESVWFSVMTFELFTRFLFCYECFNYALCLRLLVLFFNFCVFFRLSRIVVCVVKRTT